MMVPSLLSQGGIPMIAMVVVMAAVIFEAALITVFVLSLVNGKRIVAIAAGVMLLASVGVVMMIAVFSIRKPSVAAVRYAPVAPNAAPIPPLSTSGALGTALPAERTASVPVPIAAMPDAFSAQGEPGTLTAPQSFAESGLSRLVVGEANREQTAWEDLDGTPFEADVYPSIARAASAAAVACLEGLKKEGATTDAEADKQLKQVHVSGEEIESRYQKLAVDHFFSTFRELMPDVLLSRSTAKRKPATRSNWDQLWIELSIQDQKQIVDSETSPTGEAVFTGAFVVDASQNFAKHDIEVNLRREFVERKEWVYDFSKFARERPGDVFTVGYSGEFKSSRAASIQSAIDKANGGISFGRGVARLNDSLVVDTFSQQLTRPYGTVWRSAVLCNLSPRFVSAAAAPAAQRAELNRVRLMQSVTGTLVLFILTFCICLGANSLTQGYFRPWVLAAGCLLMAFCGLLFLS